MDISIIAAMTKNRIIGDGNKMPWHISEELQHFKKVTMGKAMIMGRATFDSIGRRTLPGRKTIILSKSIKVEQQDCVVVDSIDNALQEAENFAIEMQGKEEFSEKNINKEVMIVGGANIYKQFLAIANKMYLSIIHNNYRGDVFFPKYEKSLWQTIAEEEHSEFTVNILEKITK